MNLECIRGDSSVKIGKLTVDLNTGVVKTPVGSYINVTPQQLDILMILSTGIYYSAQQLADILTRSRDIKSPQTYDFHAVSSNTVRNSIHDLRIRMGDSPKNPQFIKTDRGWGYQIVE